MISEFRRISEELKRFNYKGASTDPIEGLPPGDPYVNIQGSRYSSGTGVMLLVGSFIRDMKDYEEHQGVLKNVKIDKTSKFEIRRTEKGLVFKLLNGIN